MREGGHPAPADRRGDQSTRQDPIAIVRQRLHLIVLCILVAFAAAAAVTIALPKVYTATAVLLFRERPLDLALAGITSTPPRQVADPNREAATNVRLVDLPIIADRTARAIGGGLTGDEVSRKMRVEAEGKSDLVAVEASDEDRVFAARLARTFAHEFLAFQGEIDSAAAREAQAMISRRLATLPARERAGPPGAALRQGAEDLAIAASVQTGNAVLVQPPDVPAQASSPRVVRDLVLAALLGLVVGLVLAFTFEGRDRRLKDAGEIAAAVGLPVLAQIPVRRDFARSGRVKSREETVAELDPFRMLRANLVYLNVERKVQTLMVVSADPNEGKSTVALHLALLGAESGSKVLLLEADLRHPVLTSWLAVEARSGLTTALANPLLTLADVRYRLPIETLDAQDSMLALDVVTAGPVPPFPARLVESPRMAALLDEAMGQYDAIVIDTPPLAMVPDAIPLLRKVDGVLVVTRVGAITCDVARRLRGQLEHFKAPTLGVVANFTPRSDDL